MLQPEEMGGAGRGGELEVSILSIAAIK